MAGRRGFSPRRGSGAGLSRDWALGPGASAQQTISTTSVTIIGAGVVSTVSQITIMRTRGLLMLNLLTAGVVGDGFTGAFGIMVASDQAFGNGVASMPSPVNEMEANVWLYHQFISVHRSLGVGAASEVQRIDVDSKAMRKFDDQQTMVGILEVTETGTATMNVSFDSRILVQDSGR